KISRPPCGNSATPSWPGTAPGSGGISIAIPTLSCSPLFRMAGFGAIASSPSRSSAATASPSTGSRERTVPPRWKRAGSRARTAGAWAPSTSSRPSRSSPPERDRKRPRRQSRRDRETHSPRCAGHGNPFHRRLLRGGRGLAARAGRRPRRADRPCSRPRELSQHRPRPPCRPADARPGHPSRVRLSLRELALRQGVRGGRPRLRGPLVAGDPADGRQGRRARPHEAGGRTRGFRQRRAGRLPRRGGPRRLPCRLPAHAQGGGGRGGHPPCQGRRRGRPCPGRPPPGATGAARPRPRRALPPGRYPPEPRHVEVQVFGDRHGHVVHLHERDCSIQRRHQKVIEETPAPHLSPALKERLTAAAVTGARAVQYVNAGTMEFIVQDEEFYFLEMNTRLQVEHPVTEEVTGLDIVQAQLLVASGEPLPWRQEDILQRGAAIECRIYAEDPAKNFMPSPGTLTRWVPPAGPGIRVESGVAEGCQVSVHYDPLLAKLVAAGATRNEAIARMEHA